MHLAPIILLTIIVLYFLISLQIFNNVYSTSQSVIDELFHIPQGLQYCIFNFTHWDNKITTLPGLYIISTVTIGLFFKCSVYSLRFTNLLVSCLNLYLFYLILLKIHEKRLNDFKIFLQTLNLTLLPPLYFFSHLYYTDTLSLFFVLLFIKLYLDKRNYVVLILCGAFSIIVRQTNVVWVAFCLGQTTIDISVQSYLNCKNSKYDQTHKSKTKNELNIVPDSYNIFDTFSAIIFHLQTKCKFLLHFVSFKDICEVLSLVSILIGFLIFVFVNGSIVVGDKTAHSASLHVPQVFYFTLFYGFFSIAYVSRNLVSTLSKLYRNKVLTLIFLLLCLIIVYFNTLVHPYLLADNRHYTFYVWNKFYGKYWFAKYIVTPVYIVLIVSILDNIKNSVNVGFLLSFVVCLFVSLALQTMIEVRYFFIPFVILKMWFYRPSYLTLTLDFTFNIIINFITFNTFFAKEIVWEDFSDVQRLIW